MRWPSFTRSISIAPIITKKQKDFVCFSFRCCWLSLFYFSNKLFCVCVYIICVNCASNEWFWKKTKKKTQKRETERRRQQTKKDLMLFHYYYWYDTHISRTLDHQRWRHFEHKLYFVLHALHMLNMLVVYAPAAYTCRNNKLQQQQQQQRRRQQQHNNNASRHSGNLTAALLAPHSIVGCTLHYTHVLQFFRTKTTELQQPQQHIGKQIDR